MRNRLAALLCFAAAPMAAAAQGEHQAALAPESAAKIDQTGAIKVPEVQDPVDQWRADPTISFDAADVELDDFRWIARPVVVFADTKEDPRFRQQMEYLESRPQALAERDVVVLTDTEPEALSSMRKRLRPRGFMLTLMGKDGEVKLRKPFPWDVREIGRSIDKMPTRRREINQRRNLNQ